MNLTRLPHDQEQFVPTYTDQNKLSSLIDWRKRFISNRILNFYSREELEQVKTNRRSENSDDALIEDFKSFEFPTHVIPKDEHFWKAVNIITRDFRPHRMLHPISFPDLRYYPWHLATSAEAPWTLPTYKLYYTGRNFDDEATVSKLTETKGIPITNKGQGLNVKSYLLLKWHKGLINNTATSFHNLYNEIFEHNRTFVHLIKNPQEVNPHKKHGTRGLWQPWNKKGEPVPYFWSTLHARAHVVAEDEPDKIRAVFGAPKLLLMVENMFIWNLQRTYLNQHGGRLLWGREVMRGGWKKLYSEIIHNGSPNTFLAIDWSQWDKRMTFELIDVVHMIWRSYFDFSMYEPTSFYPNASPSKGEDSIENLWTWMCHAIKHTPILLPNGELWKWNHSGFGSGYQQTQLMDSFGNGIVILTVLSSLGIRIDSERFWYRIQGDDSLISFWERVLDIYGPSFYPMVAESALYYFNAKLNIKKSLVSRRLSDMSVLGYFNRYGMPWRTDEDLLRHLLFPERAQAGMATISSAIGLAYANCGHSDRFHKLCEDIVKQLENHEFITTEERRKVKINWMQRAHMIDTIDGDSFYTSEIPDRLALRALAFTQYKRSEAECERIWPTKEDSKGGFFFLMN